MSPALKRIHTFSAEGITDELTALGHAAGQSTSLLRVTLDSEPECNAILDAMFANWSAGCLELLTTNTSFENCRTHRIIHSWMSRFNTTIDVAQNECYEYLHLTASNFEPDPEVDSSSYSD